MSDLGKLQTVHKIRMRSKAVGIIFGGICIILGGLPIVILFNVQSSAMDVVMGSVVSGTMLLLGILLVSLAFKTNNMEVRIYENGLVYSGKNFIHTVNWAEIESVSESITQIIVNGLPARKLYSYGVKTKDGNEFVIGAGFNEIEKIGERLKGETFKRRLPIVWEEFNRGETIDFGKLTLHQNGISTAKGKSLPMSDLGKIDIEDGKIRIFRKNNDQIWHTVKFCEIPNAPILLTILEKYDTRTIGI